MKNHQIDRDVTVVDLENRVAIMAAIEEERDRQDKKWGQQNHADYTWLAILSEEIGEAAQATLHTEFGGRAAGTVEYELIQAAAVIVAWLECIDRRE